MITAGFFAAHGIASGWAASRGHRQGVASQASPAARSCAESGDLSPRMILDLVRQPVWAAVVGGSVAGFTLQVAALRFHVGSVNDVPGGQQTATARQAAGMSGLG